MDATDPRRALVRQLAESGAARRHWHLADEDGRAWLFESVEGDHREHWAIRQVEVGADRVARRYWWARLQDDRGFLTDQALEIWELTEISADAFEAVWDASA